LIGYPRPEGARKHSPGFTLGELLYLQRALKRGQNRAHNKKPLCGVAAFLAPLQGASQQNNTSQGKPRVNPGLLCFHAPFGARIPADFIVYLDFVGGPSASPTSMPGPETNDDRQTVIAIALTDFAFQVASIIIG
jgi:hypothetical protein